MKKRKRYLNFMYIPALAWMVVFVIYPLIKGVYYSFFKWNGYSQNLRYVGLDNYISMFGDRLFKIAFWDTILYAMLSTFLEEVLGLGLACYLNQKFRGRNALRTIVYLPSIISALLIGYIMTFFFQYHYGVVNQILGWFGAESIDWLRDPWRGRFIIVFVTVWHYTGGSMIIFMAGIQNIPKTYLEAAKLDGANRKKLFLKVTIPLLEPAFATTVLTNMIGGIKIYDSIISLTNGGPVNKTHSLSTLISYEYFTSEKAGLASAIGVFQFIFIFFISLYINRYFRRKEVEY